MKKLRILVICGGPSGEHAVSLKSGEMVIKHLDRKKYSVTKCVIRRDRRWVIGNSKSVPMTAARMSIRGRFGAAFIAMHGEFGEDGTIQRLLDSIGIPYTGSGANASALAMDKHRTNQRVRQYRFDVPGWKIIKSKAIPLPTPFVVKPVNGGSSVETGIVKSRAEWRRWLAIVSKSHHDFIAQALVVGRELTCGVLEKNGRPFALPVTEIRPKSSTWFDYKAKYKVGGSDEITPAPLTKPQTKKIQSLTLKAHKLLGCRGMSRSDFILADGKFWFLETNTIPGLTPTSLLPQEAAAAGMSFATLLDFIVQAALKRERSSVVK